MLYLILTGSYRVDVEYGNIPIPGSPFYCKVYDGSKVKVRDVSDGIVGVKSAFLGEFCKFCIYFFNNLV